MTNATNALGKGAIGGAGAMTGMIEPSDYVSYFDRVYDIGILISGDDIARFIGVMVGVLVGCNIIYNVVKDHKARRRDRIQ